MNTILKGLAGALALGGLASGLCVPAMAQDSKQRFAF